MCKPLTTEPGLVAPDWKEEIDDTLTVQEALQNIVDSATPVGSSIAPSFYYLSAIDYNNAVAALEKEKSK